VIYDYVDSLEPMLAKMTTKRRTGYQSLGYSEVEEPFARRQPFDWQLSAVQTTPP
jgi:hypothetical protein